jgi:hypothetical protein
MDVFPAKSLTSLITPIAEDFCPPNTRIREEIDKSAIATGLDRGFSVLADIVDSFVCLLIDECSEPLAVVGRPGLLLSAFVTAIVRNGLGCIAALGDVLGEMVFTNSPTTKGGDIGVVGSDCARRSALTGEMPCIFAEMARFQLLERRHGILVLSEELDESVELSVSVASIVPALATWPFPLSVRKSSVTASIRTILHTPLSLTPA